MKTTRTANKKITAEAEELGIRFHYMRNRDPKLLHKVRGDKLSRGVPIACIASFIDRANKVIEYAVSTVHSPRENKQPLAITSAGLGLDRDDFRAFTDDFVKICTSRGVKTAVDRTAQSVRVLREPEEIDTFSYADGRRIAFGRLKVAPVEIRYSAKDEPETSLDILRLIVKSIADDKDTTTRVKREALNWLAFKDHRDETELERLVPASEVGIRALVDRVHAVDVSDRVHTIDSRHRNAVLPQPPTTVQNVRRVPRFHQRTQS